MREAGLFCTGDHRGVHSVVRGVGFRRWSLLRWLCSWSGSAKKPGFWLGDSDRALNLKKPGFGKARLLPGHCPAARDTARSRAFLHWGPPRRSQRRQGRWISPVVVAALALFVVWQREEARLLAWRFGPCSKPEEAGLRQSPASSRSRPAACATARSRAFLHWGPPRRSQRRQGRWISPVVVAALALFVVWQREEARLLAWRFGPCSEPEKAGLRQSPASSRSRPAARDMREAGLFCTGDHRGVHSVVRGVGFRRWSLLRWLCSWSGSAKKPGFWLGDSDRALNLKKPGFGGYSSLMRMLRNLRLLGSP